MFNKFKLVRITSIVLLVIIINSNNIIKTNADTSSQVWIKTYGYTTSQDIAYDIVIDNPPFSKIKDICVKLKELDKLVETLNKDNVSKGIDKVTSIRGYALPALRDFIQNLGWGAFKDSLRDLIKDKENYKWKDYYRR